MEKPVTNNPSRQAVVLDLEVPYKTMVLLRNVCEIIKARYLCIAGGFPRGLYMQQVMGLSPQMNDIDIFADLSVQQLFSVREELCEFFKDGPVRFSSGLYGGDSTVYSLVEFTLLESEMQDHAGAKSVQINFASSHPWTNPYNYIKQANIGINQVAIKNDGQVIASDLFVSDMSNHSITMNPSIQNNCYQWQRNCSSMTRLVNERSEFQNWTLIKTREPSRKKISRNHFCRMKTPILR
jgi:hypothetical protein